MENAIHAKTWHVLQNTLDLSDIRYEVLENEKNIKIIQLKIDDFNDKNDNTRTYDSSMDNIFPSLNHLENERAASKYLDVLKLENRALKKVFEIMKY